MKDGLLFKKIREVNNRKTFFIMFNFNIIHKFKLI